MPRVKGSIMVPLVKGLRASVKDAKDRLPEHLHRYLTERIIVSDWYPEEDHLVLLRFLGGSMGMIASYEPMGVILAQYELGATGVYRYALKENDPFRTLRSFVTLWPQNHDTGAMELTQTPEGYSLSLSDYALPAREVCDIVTGYLVEGLRMACHVTPKVSHVRCRARGSPICGWEIRMPAVKRETP